MANRFGIIWTYGTIVVLFIAVLALDLYFLPEHVLVSSLYAIPILVAAHRLPPRTTAIVAAVSLLLTLLAAQLKSIPTIIWPFAVFALFTIGYLGVLLAKELEQAARRTREAEDARRRLEQFMAMVAHDLRGPLTTVLGYSQVLSQRRGSASPELTSRATGIIEREAHRMDRFIGDLLDATHIGAGHFTIERRRMDLVEVARQVVEAQQATTTEHRLSLEGPESLEGWWDADRIAQVLTNLVSNAIKYSPQGGEIRVCIARAGDKALVRVSDQGVGLARQDIPQLFEPFSRLYGEQPIRGMGLGLYIAKAIVEAHGGRIRAESAGRGKGSTFSFTLPLSAEANRRSQDGAGEAREEGHGSERALPPRSQRG